MRTGRNDPCHCGSGTKYKKCCLAKDRKPKKPEPAPKRLVPVTSKSLRNVEATMAMLVGMAQEFPQPIRTRGNEGFYDELRRQGHTEKEVEEARGILGKLPTRSI